MEGHWGQVALDSSSLGDPGSSRQELPHGYTEQKQLQVVRQDPSAQPVPLQLGPGEGMQDADPRVGVHQGTLGGAADNSSQQHPENAQITENMDPTAPHAGSMPLQVGQVVYPADQQHSQPMFGSAVHGQQAAVGADQMPRLQGYGGVGTDQGPYAIVKAEQQQGALVEAQHEQPFMLGSSQALQTEAGALAQQQAIQQPMQNIQMQQQPAGPLSMPQQQLQAPHTISSQQVQQQPSPSPQLQQQPVPSPQLQQHQQLVHVPQQAQQQLQQQPQVMPQMQQQFMPQQQVAPAQQLPEHGPPQMQQQPVGMQPQQQQQQFMGLQQQHGLPQQPGLQQQPHGMQPQQAPRPRRTVYSSLQSLGSDVHIASPSLPVVKHRSKKHNTITLSPTHLIHVPRTFLQEHYDIDSVLKNGLKVQIDADGTLDPDVVHATVANYQNKSGYSYHRLLGFKPVCRKYMDWRVVGWQAIDHETVRLCISKPAPPAQNMATESSEQEGGDPSRPSKMQKRVGKTSEPGGPMMAGGNMMPGGWMPANMQMPAHMGGSMMNCNHVNEDGMVMYNMNANHTDGTNNSSHNSSQAGGNGNNSVLLSTVPLQPVGGGMAYATWTAPETLQGEQLQHMLQVLQQQDWSQQLQQQPQAMGLQPQQQQAEGHNQEGSHRQAVGPYQILDPAGVQQLLAQQLPPAQGQQLNNRMQPPTLIESLKQQQGILLSQQPHRASNGNTQMQLLASGTLEDMNQGVLQPQQQYQQAYNQHGHQQQPQQQQQLLPAPGTACLARSSSGAPIVLAHTSEGVIALPLVQPGTSNSVQVAAAMPQMQQVQQVQQVSTVQQVQQLQQYQPGPTATFQLLDNNGNTLQQQMQHPQQQMQQQPTMLAPNQQQGMQQNNQQQQPTAVLVVGHNSNLMGQVGHNTNNQMQQVQLQGGTPQMLSHQGGSTYSLAFSGYSTGTTATMHMQQAAPLQATAPTGAVQLRVTQPGNTLLLAPTQPTGMNQSSGYDVIYQLPAQQQ